MEDLVTPMSETQIMFIIDISKIIRSHKGSAECCPHGGGDEKFLGP